MFGNKLTDWLSVGQLPLEWEGGDHGPIYGHASDYSQFEISR